jgi:hypothetical protein
MPGVPSGKGCDTCRKHKKKVRLRLQPPVFVRPVDFGESAIRLVHRAPDASV